MRTAMSASRRSRLDSAFDATSSIWMPGSARCNLASSGGSVVVHAVNPVYTRWDAELLPMARQGMMDEHIYASGPFKGVRINTSYSYGIDDQEFVVSFDSDHPQEFVDLVHRLRYTEASMYTLQDTPMFQTENAKWRNASFDLGST